MLMRVAKLLACIVPEFVVILLTVNINSLWVIVAEFYKVPFDC